MSHTQSIASRTARHHIIHIVPISGGKDSQATALWALQEIPKKWGSRAEIRFVFNDVGWEAPETYAHIEYLEREFSRPIIRLRSSRYEGFADMVKRKGHFPSVTRRFCTEILKIQPMIDYVLSLRAHVLVYLGQRREESHKRARLPYECQYFKHYFQSYGHDKNGRPKYHSYRKAEVLAWSRTFNADVVRPILDWTTQDVFDYIHRHGQRPNPLYSRGFTRVGCFPCVMCNLKEVRLITKHAPERIDEVAKLEREAESTFFRPGTIPNHACSQRVQVEGKVLHGTVEDESTLIPGFEHSDVQLPDYTAHLPTVHDVARYLEESESALGEALFPDDSEFGRTCGTQMVQCE